MKIIQRSFNVSNGTKWCKHKCRECRTRSDCSSGSSLIRVCTVCTDYLYKNTLRCTIFQGQANIEIRNNRQQTPLLLAVSQGHTSILELLVAKGADVNVEDEDGDTCIHLALMRHNVSTEREDSPMLDSVSLC